MEKKKKYLRKEKRLRYFKGFIYIAVALAAIFLLISLIGLMIDDGLYAWRHGESPFQCALAKPTVEDFLSGGTQPFEILEKDSKVAVIIDEDVFLVYSFERSEAKLTIYDHGEVSRYFGAKGTFALKLKGDVNGIVKLENPNLFSVKTSTPSDIILIYKNCLTGQPVIFEGLLE